MLLILQHVLCLLYPMNRYIQYDIMHGFTSPPLNYTLRAPRGRAIALVVASSPQTIAKHLWKKVVIYSSYSVSYYKKNRHVCDVMPIPGRVFGSYIPNLYEYHAEYWSAILVIKALRENIIQLYLSYVRNEIYDYGILCLDQFFQHLDRTVHWIVNKILFITMWKKIFIFRKPLEFDSINDFFFNF